MEMKGNECETPVTRLWRCVSNKLGYARATSVEFALDEMKKWNDDDEGERLIYY